MIRCPTVVIAAIVLSYGSRLRGIRSKESKQRRKQLKNGGTAVSSRYSSSPNVQPLNVPGLRLPLSGSSIDALAAAAAATPVTPVINTAMSTPAAIDGFRSISTKTLG
jgi:hypothetical protein